MKVVLNEIIRCIKDEYNKLNEEQSGNELPPVLYPKINKKGGEMTPEELVKEIDRISFDIRKDIQEGKVNTLFLNKKDIKKIKEFEKKGVK